MNVLLITFSFPPAGGVGVLRALSLAKYLPESDINVHVLTARNAPAVGKDATLLAQVPASVRIHRTWTLDLPFALRKALKKQIAAAKPAPPTPAQNPPQPGEQPAANAPTPRGLRPFLKRTLGNLLLPDPQVGWLPFAFRAARRIVRKHKIDAVIITVPPFSTLLLVPRLRRAFPNLPIAADFRDEWLSTTLHLVSFNSNQRAREVATVAEREAVRDATCVVAVTEAARREIAGRYPDQPAAKFQCIPNGFDTAAKPTAAPTPPRSRPITPDDPLVLTYIGSVYGSTDPGTFVQAIQALPPELRACLRVRFIGHIETDAYRSLLLSLGPQVELVGFLPQAEALRAMQDTDFLLLITHDRINVSAKFYDYLSGSKPILAAVHPEGDVRRLLEQTGAGRWADINSPDAIRQVLAEALTDGAGQPLARDEDRIASFHRRALAGRYADLLRGLVTRER